MLLQNETLDAEHSINASQVTSFVWPTCRTAVHKAENKTQAHTEKSTGAAVEIHQAHSPLVV